MTSSHCTSNEQSDPRTLSTLSRSIAALDGLILNPRTSETRRAAAMKVMAELEAIRKRLEVKNA